MLPIHIALITNTAKVDSAGLSAVSAAVQAQATRDFGPIWNVTATVDPFSSLTEVPAGSWPVIVQDSIPVPGAGGFHLSAHGQPYALVAYSDTWSLAVSHETMEMLADPFGFRTQAAPSPEDHSKQVEFLVEVSDPCQAAEYAYSIDGILVSDFITPSFYDAVTRGAVSYSFTGAIHAPRTVLRGGYMSFLDAVDNHMHQEIWRSDADQPEFRDLGTLARGTGSLREWVDSKTPHPELEHGAAPEVGALAWALARQRGAVATRNARAETLLEELRRSSSTAGEVRSCASEEAARVPNQHGGIVAEPGDTTRTERLQAKLQKAAKDIEIEGNVSALVEQRLRTEDASGSTER